MISIQTNVDSMVAQQNLNLDNQLQSNTIQQLTSGYRINKSGDDAAGLAVANGLDSAISQLNQGVNNANDGVSQLQIVDGGLSNISTILNRLQTLATESASTTFTGDRSTLNTEYSGLLSEITRQASNINLASGGSFNSSLNVFVGGGSSAANSTVSINLSGAENAVDATSLGLSTSNVLGGGTGFTGNSVNLNGGTYLTNSSEKFAFNTAVNGVAASTTITVTGASGGLTGSQVLAQLNQSLSTAQLGITASLSSSGGLQFTGTSGFNVTDLGAAGTVSAPGTAQALITGTGTVSANNAASYALEGQAATSTIGGTAVNIDTLTFQTGGQTATVTLNASNASTLASQLTAINAVTSQYGISAVSNKTNTGIDFQSNTAFTVADSPATGSGVLAVGGNAAQSPTAPTGSATANADAAITSINNAIQQLGLTQGVVGAGENTLNYAINLATSQISNFSSEESGIKDANVAAEAANLSKSQVLVQTAVAALAQANSEPQAILKLLQ